MNTAALAHQTKVATWGNSAAVRLHRKILERLGIAAGDSVDVVVNERNNIEIIQKEKSHRRVRPMRGITFESLFAGYEPKEPPSNPWPDDELVGAEAEAWMS